MIKDFKNLDNWSLSKKRKFFWIFTIFWVLIVYLIDGEWLYFIPFIMGDIIFWKTINYTFWKKRKKKVEKTKSWLKSWGDASLFAVIAATILRTFFIEAYTIPTPSMEKSLMVGDYLFVSKTSFGPRVPITPLSFPLVHHTLPVVGGKSYLEWIQIPYHRMSGWKVANTQSPIGVERNDCVVFNWPAERLYNYKLKISENYKSILKKEVDDIKNHQDYNEIDKITRNRFKNTSDANEFLNSRKLKLKYVVAENIYSRPIDKKENYVKR